MYELGKMQHIEDFERLTEFAQWRDQFGTQLIFPVQYLVKDRLIHVLPGDDLYPKEPDYEKPNEDFEMYKEKSVEDLMQVKHLHRTVHESMSKSVLSMNIRPANQHLCPLGVNSKLEEFPIKQKL